MVIVFFLFFFSEYRDHCRRSAQKCMLNIISRSTFITTFKCTAAEHLEYAAFQENFPTDWRLVCQQVVLRWRQAKGGPTAVVITGHAPRTGPRYTIVNCATSKISSGDWLCKCSQSSDNKQRNPPTASGQTATQKHVVAPLAIHSSTECQWPVL